MLDRGEYARFERARCAAQRQGAELAVNELFQLLRRNPLLGEAGLDSFGTMQVIVFLEEEYGIQVPEDQFEINDFATVSTIAGWALPLINARR